MTNEELIKFLKTLPLDYEMFIHDRKSDDQKILEFVIDGELKRISLKSE